MIEPGDNDNPFEDNDDQEIIAWFRAMREGAEDMYDSDELAVHWWNDMIPDLANRGYEMIGLRPSVVPDMDMQAVMAIIGFNALTSTEDKRGDYDLGTALVDL